MMKSSLRFSSLVTISILSAANSFASAGKNHANTVTGLMDGALRGPAAIVDASRRNVPRQRGILLRSRKSSPPSPSLLPSSSPLVNKSADGIFYGTPRYSTFLPLSVSSGDGDGKIDRGGGVKCGYGFSSHLSSSLSGGKGRGRVTLLLVACLYGTLNVTLRAVYSTPGPPAPSVLSLVRQLLSTICFVPLLWTDTERRCREKSDGNGGWDEGVVVGGSGDATQKGKDGTAAVAPGPMWKAALELAFWNFGAQGLINAGLVLSPAGRAAFLTQTSVVITPLLSAALGEQVGKTVWAGCSLALCGLVLITTGGGGGVNVDAAADGVASAASAIGSSIGSAGGILPLLAFNQGDVMILGGAFFWSTYVYRTSKLAGSFRELELQATKTAFIALLYGGWACSTMTSVFLSPVVGAAGATMGGWKAVGSLWSGWYSLPVWIMLGYSAVGPGAVADVLQQRGQREVSASEANVLICFESVFAAVCAYIFLGEVSSLQEIAGGMLIVAAAVLASL